METYNGHVRTPQDAIILFEACRLGVLPRVQRRLSEKERQQIRSGSVFVWDEREAGMRRWTDGKSWSASRVSGSFLTYREMEGKRGGNTFAPQPAKKNGAPRSTEGSRSGDGEVDSGEDGPDGYRYKPDGLMKQSFSITTNNGQHLHLISYYARSQATAPPLKQPSNDPTLRHIRPAKGMYPEATVNEAQSVPAVTRGPMPGSPYAAAPQQIAVAQPYAHPLAPGYPHPGYPAMQWPGSPVGSYGYFVHHPGHPIPHAYYHPYAPPPPTAPDRPPHLSHLPPPPPAVNGHSPPPRHSPYYSNGYPPQGPPHPASTPYPAPDYRSHLPSPGLPTSEGARDASLHIHPLNGHKPLTPPPSTSSTAAASMPERPQSSDAAANGTANGSKVLPTIGALINAESSTSQSARPAPLTNGDANGQSRSQPGSHSPDARAAAVQQPASAGLPPSNDKASCRADMMAIRALDGRFHKPTA